LSFHNSYSYLKKIDQLPHGPEWKCEIITAQGDILDENGSRMVEDLELWYRDPVECVRELLSNPAFKEYVCYAPERVYSDNEGKERIFDEMWTGDWWWEMQVGRTWAVEKDLCMKTNLDILAGQLTGWRHNCTDHPIFRQDPAIRVPG
jgi:hypothetical protein